MKARRLDAHPLVRILLGLALAMVTSAATARDKTDVVTLKNGDRLTGEILNLEFGKLVLKTDSLDTVAINWPDVASVQSNFRYLIEGLDGHKLYGQLSSHDGRLTIDSDGEPVDLELIKVAKLAPAEHSFAERIKGSASVGVNYSNASSIKVSSFRLDAQYHGERTLGTLSFSSDLTSSPTEGTRQRLRLDYSDRLLLADTRFLAATGTFERIDELGIDGRLQAGITGGRSLWQRPDANFDMFGGLAINEEWTRGTQASTFGVEGVLGLDWRIYKFRAPELALHTSLIAYPSLSELGRWRARFDSTVVYKIGGDFTWSFSAYDDYDSRPPGTQSVSNGVGLVTSLGYSF